MEEKPVKLNPQIWRQLPRELIEHILVFLPIKSFFNLRSTCKRFYTIIFSPSFISKHSAFHSLTNNTSSSFLLLSHPQFQQQFPLYDFTNTHWRISGLPLSNTGSPSTSHLLSASNGLLCFSRPLSYSLLVCNLLTGSSKIIRFPLLNVDFDSVTLISSSIGYKIFVLCSGCSSNYTYIYDSVTRNWSKFPRISRRNSNFEGVHCNGYLYFTTPEPFSVLGFDLKRSKWRNPIENLPGAGELTFARLASNEKEKLYLIGGTGSHGISRSMKIWEFGEDGDWVETGSLPNMLCKKFMSICYHNYQHVYCFYHDGVICVCCYTWPEVLCYKIARETWHWLPRCPSLPEKWSCGFKWFSFVPNFYALV
ncbi:hypothetical protein ACHQM5_024901 [Ranunculus cassubicifolius]